MQQRYNPLYKHILANMGPLQIFKYEKEGVMANVVVITQVQEYRHHCINCILCYCTYAIHAWLRLQLLVEQKMLSS